MHRYCCALLAIRRQLVPTVIFGTLRFVLDFRESLPVNFIYPTESILGFFTFYPSLRCWEHFRPIYASISAISGTVGVRRK